MPPKKLTPRGQAAEPAGNKAIASQKAATKSKPAPKRSTKSASSTKYIRNTRGVEIRVTFDTGRKIVLSPRGQRNDMTAISKEELDDPIFLNNLGSLYEMVSAKEFAEIREKQNTNSSSFASPRPEDILRTALDEPSEFAGVEMSDAEKSITIARLNEIEGRPNEDKATEIVPVREGLEPARLNVPGSDA